MEPRAVELIERIAQVLRERIAPLVADQPWPASELRSIDALLALVAARIEHEDEVLGDDNDALDVLLAQLSVTGLPVRPLAIAPGATAHDANVERRTALEEMIHHIHDGAPRSRDRCRAGLPDHRCGT